MQCFINALLEQRPSFLPFLLTLYKQIIIPSAMNAQGFVQIHNIKVCLGHLLLGSLLSSEFEYAAQQYN